MNVYIRLILAIAFSYGLSMQGSFATDPDALKMEMQEPKKTIVTPTLDLSNIDFNSIINEDEKEYVELHFFWGTGRPYQLLEDKYNADRTVHIGGSKYAQKFKYYIYDFLRVTPQKVRVIFIADRLTSESNAPLFGALSAEFGKRFQLVPWEELTQTIYSRLPDHAPKLEQFFNQGFRGNPVIASDVYRLVGMPLINEKDGIPFSKKMWTYSDIDTFTYGLEHKEALNYITAILGTRAGNFTRRGNDNSDVLKMGFDNRENYIVYVTDVMKKLSDSLDGWRFEDINPLNYISKVLSFAEANDFFGYMATYSSDIDKGSERSIISFTGPNFLKNNGITDACLTYPKIFGLEWNLITHYTYGVHKYTSHIDEDDYTIHKAFEKYLPHLRRAMIIHRMGSLHPFNMALTNWLKENNPYTSAHYNSLVKNYIASLPGGMEELKTTLEKEEEAVKGRIELARTPTFFRMREALRKIGINFPIVPDGE